MCMWFPVTAGVVCTGDPGLPRLEWLGGMKDLIIAVVVLLPVVSGVVPLFGR